MPVPNKNKENTIQYVEVITKAIIKKEIKENYKHLKDVICKVTKNEYY